MRSRFLWAILIVVTIGGIFAYRAYTKIMAPNVPDQLADDLVIIPTNATFKDVVQMLH